MVGGYVQVGRMMTMLFILVGIAFFTTVTHDSVDMVRYLRSGHGRYPKLSGIPHCVIVGDLSPETLVPFFQEFFSESRRNRSAQQQLVTLSFFARCHCPVFCAVHGCGG